MLNKQLGRFVLLSASTLILSGCGILAGDDEAIDRNFDPNPIPTATPTPSPTPTPTPTPTPSSCPTGTADGGSIVNGEGENLQVCQLPSVVMVNLTLQQIDDIVYSIDGPTVVGIDAGPTGGGAGGVSLNIDAGVTVFAESDTSILTINRGSQINVQGAADNPVIFTSQSNLQGTSTVNSGGSWGGIAILGNAPVANCESGDPSNPGGARTDCERSLPFSGTNPKYGGTDQSSDAGTFEFVQIREAGASIGGGEGLVCSLAGSALISRLMSFRLTIALVTESRFLVATYNCAPSS